MGRNPTDLSGDLDRAQAEMDRLYQEMVAPGGWVVVRHTHVWRPPTDVYECDEDVVVRVEVAGMKESDFNVSLTDRLLVISGVREDPSPKVAYHQMEVRYGEFRTGISLPWPVDREKVAATYKDGFLRVELPRALNQQVHIVNVDIEQEERNKQESDEE
jgi:HSP20 family protein